MLLAVGCIICYNPYACLSAPCLNVCPAKAVNCCCGQLCVPNGCYRVCDPVEPVDVCDAPSLFITGSNKACKVCANSLCQIMVPQFVLLLQNLLTFVACRLFLPQGASRLPKSMANSLYQTVAMVSQFILLLQNLLTFVACRLFLPRGASRLPKSVANSLYQIIAMVAQQFEGYIFTVNIEEVTLVVRLYCHSIQAVSVSVLSKVNTIRLQLFEILGICAVAKTSLGYI